MKEIKNSPKWQGELDGELQEAIATLYDFIYQVTGQPPSQSEIAAALKRYFVLNEIKEHIVMDRMENKG